MFSKIRSRMQGEGGFTLIELLVVIIIIAILAAIAIPTFLGQRQKAQDASAKSLVRNAMTAVESTYVDIRNFDTIVATDIEEVEPSIDIIEAASAGTDPTADAQANQANYEGISIDSYEVGSLSQSGKSFGVLVNKGASGGNTFYVNGTQATW